MPLCVSDFGIAVLMPTTQHQFRRVLGVVANLFKGRDMFGKGDAIGMLTGRFAGVCRMNVSVQPVHL